MSFKEFPISIGLDFGTYQTKACIRFKRSPNLPAEYHFVPLNKNETGMDVYFLPSVISEKYNGKFAIGETLNDARFTYSFFKIASAEDEEFRLEAGISQPKYDPKRFEPYTPEFLAVVYIAYVIDIIKRYVKYELKPGQQNSAPNQGFLAKFQSQQVQNVNYQWTIQMGVPTEYKDRHNALRKRKFQQILYMASELSENAALYFHKGVITSWLQSRVDMIFDNLLNQFNHSSVRDVDEATWNYFLTTRQLSVFPETAAGLNFLVKTNKLTKDKYYLALDIGGGSTDVSFFKVEANNTFTYLASKSAMMASNDVGLQVFGSSPSLPELRKKLIKLFSQAGVSNDRTYRRAFKKVLGSINRHVYKMFNTQVYFRFKKLNATEIYKDTTCYLYGGGALMPIAEPNPEEFMESILIHDNGVSNSFTSSGTYVQVRPIRELQFSENVFPESWRDKMDFLIVPLGLSLALSDDITTRLNEDFYSRSDLVKPTKFFNIRSAKWV